jgi:hypothetical protein
MGTNQTLKDGTKENMSQFVPYVYLGSRLYSVVKGLQTTSLGSGN